MRELVMYMLNISGQATLIFAVLLAVRGIFALGRIPKKYAYGMWAILFIRLLLPWQVESGWGLMPRESGLVSAVGSALQMGGQEDGGQERRLGQPVRQENAAIYQADENGQEGPEPIAANRYDTQGNGDMVLIGTPETAGLSGQPKQAWRPPGRSDYRESAAWTFCGGIWAVVFAALCCHGLFSWMRLKKRLCCSIPLEGWGERVYLADGIGTPFVMGLTKPGIYLPSDMERQNIPYVIAHERTHIRRGDYLVKLGAYLISCLYWFHPLVWAGFVLMCRDMEMSCDEAVLGQMRGRLGKDCRREYADSLMRLTCPGHYPTAAPPAFGKGGTKGRVRHIMAYKKATIAAAACAVVTIAVLAAVLLTSPGQTERPSLSGEAEPEDKETSGPGNTVGFSVQYEEIPCPAAVRTGYTSLGADGPILDYADGELLIFHGWFGLYVYSVSAGQITGAVDLQTLGCGYTQGDNACQVLVAGDGARIYFYPLGGMAESEDSFSCYVYEVSGGRLRSMTYDLKQAGGNNIRENLQQLLGEELFGGAQRWSSTGLPMWGQGFCSDSGILFEENGEQVRGYLTSAGDTLEDLVFIRERGYTESGESRRTEAVQLFGAEDQEGSVLSYESQSLLVTIDGMEYHMDQIVTEYRFGDMVEKTAQPVCVNAVTGVKCVDGLWIVEGHISPYCGIYSIYDPGENMWQEHIIADSLAWSNRDESLALREEKRLDTTVYSLYNRIYSLADGQLAVLDTGAAESSEMNLPREYILRLGRAGDEIFVTVRSVQTEEERTFEFSFEEALREVIRLK